MEWLGYWNKRARAYKRRDPESREILQDYINRVKPRSLIEVGCGPGFLFELYGGIPQVTAVDWSPLMVKKAIQKCADHKLKVNVFLHDIATKPPVGHWQLAVTRHCLMHIPKERAKPAIENIAEICDEALIFEWWLDYTPEADTGHCFLHDYESLFKNVGFRLHSRFDCKADVRQTLFWFKK